MELPPELSPRVSQLILATKSHSCLGDDAECRLLLDADLAILGAAPPTYEGYARAIRQEFAFVPEIVYRSARRTVLAEFLARERIYSHPLLFNKRERLARANISGEISRLAKKD